MHCAGHINFFAMQPTSNHISTCSHQPVQPTACCHWAAWSLPRALTGLHGEKIDVMLSGYRVQSCMAKKLMWQGACVLCVLRGVCMAKKLMWRCGVAGVGYRVQSCMAKKLMRRACVLCVLCGESYAKLHGEKVDVAGGGRAWRKS